MNTHQIIKHGDNTLWLPKLKDNSVKSLITDPPFGVNNQSGAARTPEGRAAARKIANDQNTIQAMHTFSAMWEQLAPKMKPESDLYVFTSWQVLEEWLTFTKALFRPLGYQRKAMLVWEKEGPGMGDLDTWGMCMEFCLYYKRGKWTLNGARRNSVLHTPQLRPADLIHPHEKPERLLEELIKHSTDPGDLVVDPFGGSGSLARAARNTDRSAFVIEYDEFNYKEAVKKFEQGDEGLGL